MKIESIYLDTSVPCAYYDNRSKERQKVTVKFWNETLPGYNVFISDITIDELNKTGEEKLLRCDTVLFSVGLIPEQDLLIEAGIEPGNGIYLVGNADYIHDYVDTVSREAEKLGKSLSTLA